MECKGTQKGIRALGVGVLGAGIRALSVKGLRIINSDSPNSECLSAECPMPIFYYFGNGKYPTLHSPTQCVDQRTNILIPEHMITKKRGLIVALTCMLAGSAPAQLQNIVWAKDLGGGSPEEGWDIAADAAGNVYTIGMFEGTIDLDPGSGTALFTSTAPMGNRDIYISKLDAGGNFVWGKQIEARSGNTYMHQPSVALNANGDVVISGVFRGIVDFDPGPGTSNLNGDQYFNIFICKLTAAGNFSWAKMIAGYSSEIVCGLTTDASGNIYTAGYFSDSTDFDPGPGVYKLASANMYNVAAFVSKLDANGNFVWAKKLGGAVQSVMGDHACALAVDATGNVYITGEFDGTEDFDPGAGTASLTATGNFDSFVVKLDANGNYAWAVSTGGTTSNEFMRGHAVAIGNNGSTVYYTGEFAGGFDFDPGAGTTVLGSGTDSQIFVSALDAASGSFQWAKAFTGTGQTNLASDIAIDTYGQLYISGQFSNTMDFDPGAGTFSLSASFLIHTYFVMLTSQGNFVWANEFTDGNTTCNALYVDAAGSLYLTGGLNDFYTVDFDPGPGTYTLPPATGYSDTYVVRFSPTDLGIANTAGASSVSVFPNPAAGSVNIQLANASSGTARLYNTAGGLVYAAAFNGSSVQLDVSTLPGGLYMLETESGGVVTRTKVVVAHQ